MRAKAALVVALAGASRALPAQVADAGAAIAAYVDRFAAGGHFSGAILVADGPRVVLERAWGSTGVTSRRANTPTTLYAVASVTKPLTGIMARTLAARGVLPLDATIDRWLPDFEGGSRITVNHLLAHRAGIPHRVTTMADERRQQSAASMTRLASEAPRRFAEPGAQRVYSSTGYSVLARVMEVASGRRYHELLHEIVLDPAGAWAARDATETLPASAVRARGHFWAPTGPLAAPEKSLSFLVGAGSLWATPRDLFSVVRWLAGGGYAGASAGAQAPDGTIEWSGFSNGAMAWVAYRPATQLTVIVVSNLLTGAMDHLMRDIPRLAQGQPVEPPAIPQPRPRSLSTARRAALSGPYDYFGNRQTLAFVSPSIALLGGEYLLVATSDTTFFAPQNYTQYRVESDTVGVRALRLDGPNGFEIRRIR